MGTLLVGSDRREITPDRPVPMSGYAGREHSSTGTHDPLWATSLVLDDGATAIGIVSLDLLNTSWEMRSRVEKRLADAGVPIDVLLLAATHTHAGPYIPAPAIAIKYEYRLPDDEEPADVDRIEKQIVSSLRSAYDRRKPGSIGVGRAENDVSAVNRRAVGGVGGNVRMPTGDIDPELTVLDVRTESGEEAVVFNYACHPVCTTPNETLLSADWPGYARRHLFEDDSGPNILFLNGAAGDINPRDWDGGRSGDEVYEYMESVGAEVAETVCEARADARESDSIESAPIVAERREFSLPVKDTPSPESLEARLEELDADIDRLEKNGHETGAAQKRTVRRYVRELLTIAEWDATRLPATMDYVSVGDVGILTMPGEVFVEHGHRFKNVAEVDTLVTTGYTNGYVGYIPTLKELDNVGYEVRTTKIAPEAISAFKHAGFDLISES